MLKYTKGSQDTETVTIGDIVMSDATDMTFAVAGIDGDCVLRAEDGAWLHVDDVTLLYPLRDRISFRQEA